LFFDFNYGPLVWLGLGLVLVALRALARRRAYLAFVPMGLLVLYTALRAAAGFLDWFIHEGRLAHNLGVAAAVVFSWWTVRLAFYLFVEETRRRRGLGEVPRITRELVLVVGYSAVGLFTLRVAGDLDLTSLITTSAVLTVVVGFAAQSTLGALFAGIALQMERPLTLDDWISNGDLEGRVVGITWRSTQLLGRKGEIIVIPNDKLLASTFTNFTRSGRGHLATLAIGLDYSAPPDRVRRVLLQLVQSHPLVVAKPEPEVWLRSFGDSSIEYVLRFWIQDYSREPAILAELNRRMWYALQREQISIPFPIRDVRHHHIEGPRAVDAAEELHAEGQRALRQVPVLGALDDELLVALGATMHTLDFGTDEVVVHEGAQGESLFVVGSGACAVRVADRRGAPKTVATLRAGDVFGEMSLLTGERRRASVVALEESRVLEFRKAELQPLLEGSPELQEALARLLAARNLELDDEEASIADSIDTEGMLHRIRKFFGSS
jgi:small-conductance mechanosensitive channel